MTTAIILAAGKGSRFADQGVSTPKPLLKVSDSHLMDFALTSAQDFTRVLVATSGVLRGYRGLPSADYFIEVTVTQQGPAFSALLAGAHIPPFSSVVILDSDVILRGTSVRDFVHACQEESVTAGILTTWLDNPEGKYCTVKTDPDDIDVTDLFECSEWPSSRARIAVGAYYFASWDTYKAHLFKIATSISTGREIFTSDVLKQYLAFSDVKAYDIPVEHWIPLGTPKELENALARII